MPALGFPRPKIRTSLWGDLHALRIVSQWGSLSMPSTAPFGGCLWRGAPVEGGIGAATIWGPLSGTSDFEPRI